MAGYNISTTPGEETMPDGSTCWTFLNSTKFKVKVFLKTVVDALLSQRDPKIFLGGVSNTKDVPKDIVLPSIAVAPSAWVQPIAQAPIHLQPPPPYDFMDQTLPVGWFQDGKPALMADLLDHPFDIKDPLWDLTDAQKWALVEVRVRKSPGFHSPICTFVQTDALIALQLKTAGGLMLRDEEIESLHALREDLMVGIT